MGEQELEQQLLSRLRGRGHLVGMGCSSSGSRCLCLELCIPLPVGTGRRDRASAVQP